jgi:membrane fusion protein, multidrug efflux system
MKPSSIGGLFAVAAALGLSSCSRQVAAPPLPPPRVSVALAQSATVTNWDTYPAHLEAIETVEVRCRVTGYIESIHFVEGAEVKAGDLLVVIDPRTYQADLDHAKAQREQAETHLELARNDLRRAEGLRGTKAISEEDYDNRSKAVREAEAALAAAKASETMARINLEFTQVRAPINGRIGRRLVTVGNFVQLQANNGASTLLATLVSQDPIYCYFDADEPAYLLYRQNGMAGQAIPCELALVNETGFPHRGKVDFYDNQLNPRTGTIRMRAVFDNADRALMSGMFANVRVPAGPPCQALLVPDVAIGSDQGRRFVYVVNADNQIETRMVKPDRQHGALRAILEGLHPEDRVVTNGFALVRDKMKVQVQ